MFYLLHCIAFAVAESFDKIHRDLFTRGECCAAAVLSLSSLWNFSVILLLRVFASGNDAGSVRIVIGNKTQRLIFLKLAFSLKGKQFLTTKLNSKSLASYSSNLIIDAKSR